MKSAYLASLAFSALLCGCAVAYAQTPATVAADPSTMSATSTQRDANGALSTARSTGQDKTTGNDMVSANKSGMQLGARPDFNTLDTNKNGYLIADDVKNHKWPSKNFSKCDLNHDGHLSQEEYAKCTK